MFLHDNRRDMVKDRDRVETMIATLVDSIPKERLPKLVIGIAELPALLRTKKKTASVDI